jgi:hypothetical protein
MSLRELLSYDQGSEEAGTGPSQRVRMVEMGFRFYLYITQLALVHRRLCGILYELRARGLSTPVAVLGWLQEVTGKSEDELELGFRAYCLHGTVPHEQARTEGDPRDLQGSAN